MYQVTPSLYNAYYWYRNSKSSSKEDFLKILNREPTEQTELMLKGIEFENMIEEETRTAELTGNEAVDEIASMVADGEWQKSVNGMLDKWQLSGRIDVYFPYQIYDIKYCEKYELEKYKYSIQHLVYMYCTMVWNFEYLIYSEKDRQLYKESYIWDSQAQELLRSRLNELTEFIFGVPEFREAYLEHWVTK